MDLLDQFRRHLATLPLPKGPALVAVSGGPDSVALLDLLVRSADAHRLALMVAHFDHGIHPESAAVAVRVRELAAAMGLPFEGARGELGPDAGETAAREARYAFLHSLRVRLAAGSIFLAHHADDQAETVLMRVLAGSGSAGLAGIAPVSGPLVRPLLPFRRAALARYVQIRNLPIWLDPANDDPRHQRAWLRSELLPLVRKRLPDVDSALVRGAAHARRNRVAWDKMLDVLPGLDPALEPGGISVAGGILRGYDSTLVESLLLAAGRRAGCPLGPVRAARVMALLESGVSGSEVPLSGGWKAELSFGRLRLVRGAPGVPPPGNWNIDGERGEGSWGAWRVAWRLDAVPARQERVGLTAWFTPDLLTVRGWSAGDKVRPLAGTGRRLVVRCFQEARVPRGRRASWPVVAGTEEVVWIPGVCRSDALIPAGGTEALRVDVDPA
ncbi:MAG: tRNA lysidine(34) synthetase TilS [Gemmatimonadales bacterium]